MKKSFTLIEILVVTTITLIFLGVGLVQYNTYTEQAKLKNEGKKLVDVLELAKKKALSADLQDKNCINFTGYRVSILSSSYSLLFGCTSVYSLVQNYNLTSNMTIISGIGDYNFPPLMINPVFPSDIITFYNSNINKIVELNVSSIGIFELDETMGPPVTPIILPSSTPTPTPTPTPAGQTLPHYVDNGPGGEIIICELSYTWGVDECSPLTPTPTPTPSGCAPGGSACGGKITCCGTCFQGTCQ